MTNLKVAAPGFGGDALPASQPQYIEDQAANVQYNDYGPHDEPGFSQPTSEYDFFYGNGQLHLSPDHDHDQLRGHAGVSDDHTGPIAVGHVSVQNGDALWSVDGNVALKGLARIFKDYTKHVGWKWGGLTTLDGEPVDDEFAPKKSMEIVDNETGITRSWVQQGKTAHLIGAFPKEAREWLVGQGYKLSEYPGGTDMNDRMHNYGPAGEQMEIYTRGDNKGEFPETNPDENPTGTFKCPHCRQVFPNWSVYQEHRREEDGMTTTDQKNTDNGYFPELNMDVPLPPKYHEKRPFIMPLGSAKEAERYYEFDEYDEWLGLSDGSTRIYGAFRDGKMRGFAAVRGNDLRIVRGSTTIDRESLVKAIQTHHSSLTTDVEAIDQRTGFATGFTRTASGYKWSAGKDPKDQLDSHVPFIYDVQEDRIVIGYPGERHSDIPGKFTPGGIVEGVYEPGGKVIIKSMTNIPYTVRHMVELWYWMHPQMEVTGVELQDAAGGTTKLAKISGQSVGAYIRNLAVTDPSVWTAYQALKKEGGEVYVVGGAVRDALLQKEPKDIDLMVTGLPSEVVNHTLEKLPGRVDLTGKNFGVYRYRTRGHEVEIALPRTEKSTGDRRVHFDVNVDHELPVEDDLLRRDFTVNAMAVNLDTGELVDPYHGAEDIKDRRLRTTHPSSFQEDPTRLIRALVMNGRYGFEPDEETRRQMREYSKRLALESPDAKQPILEKLLSSKKPAEAIRLARETGLLEHIVPELDEHFDYDQKNPHHKLSLGEHHLNVLDNIAQESNDPDLRFAALLHDIGKPASAWADPATGFHHYYRGRNGEGQDHEVVGAELAQNRLRELRWPTARSNRITHLILHHMFPAFNSPKGARKFLNRVGDEHADDLLTFRWADQRGKGQSPEELAARTHIDTQRGIVEQVRSNQQPTNMSALAINGNDIIGLGVKAGPDVGRILRLLTDQVIDSPPLNDHDTLLQLAKEYIDALPNS